MDGGVGAVVLFWVCVIEGALFWFFSLALYTDSPKQFLGTFWTVGTAPVHSLLPPACPNLLFCSQSLFLPGAKMILKVGQKGGKTI